jgi:hypothetical protein
LKKLTGSQAIKKRIQALEEKVREGKISALTAAHAASKFLLKA